MEVFFFPIYDINFMESWFPKIIVGQRFFNKKNGELNLFAGAFSELSTRLLHELF